MSERSPRGRLSPLPVCEDPIFMIGSPLSGADALARSLAEHSRLWTSAEIDAVHHTGGFGRLDVSPAERQRELARRLRGNPRWSGAPDEARDDFVRFLGGCASALITARSGGKRWIEQRPEHVMSAGVLARMFPRGRFIHVLRDGRAVVDAMMEARRAEDGEHWLRKSFRLAAPGWMTAGGGGASRRRTERFRTACRTWRRHVDKAMDLAAEYPEQCLTLRHDDLIADPAPVFRRVLAFLEVPFEDGPISSFCAAPPSSEPWQAWTREQRRVFLDEAGSTMARCGFPLHRSFTELGR